MVASNIFKKITLSSSEKVEFNDQIYQDEIFQLSGRAYRFIIEPKSDFWRFGLRFSKTTRVIYSPKRYEDTNIKHIQIATGNVASPGVWSDPDKIEFGYYFFEDKSFEKLSESFGYGEKGKVEMTLNFDSIYRELFIRFSGEGFMPRSHRIFVEDYEYFHISAWADWTPFALDCTYEVTTFIINENLSFDIKTISFKIGNVSEINRDQRVFELSVIPILVDDGKPIISYGNKLKDVASPQIVNRELGKITITNTTNPSKDICWALSELRNNEVTKNAISNILKSLRIKTQQNEYSIVKIPLLGITSNSLTLSDIVAIYLEELGNFKLAKIIVYINVYEWLDQIARDYQVSLEGENHLTFKSREFLFRDKCDIDPVLNVKDIAQELSDIIIKPPTREHEGMIGIFGRWGRGKSFLIQQLSSILQKKSDITQINFHAWKYQDTPAVWAYLYELFSNEYYSSEISGFKKLWRRFRLNNARNSKWKTFGILVPLLISIIIAVTVPIETKLNILIGLIGYGLLSFLWIYFRYHKSVRGLIGDYYKKISYSSMLGSQAEIQKELRILLKTWEKFSKNHRVVLFVEDIDRCVFDKIIAIVDSLRVIVEDTEIAKRLIIVSAIDPTILQNAIQEKYRHVIDTKKGMEDRQTAELTNEYFDKLFILSINLGDLSRKDMDDFFIALTNKERKPFIVPPLQSEKQSTFSNIIQEQKESINVSDDARGKNGTISENDFANDQQAPTTDTTVKIIQEDDGKISEDEFMILRKSLSEHPTITPRQIRIFYYRYIIARNLLIRQYSKNGLYNIWAIQYWCRIFVDLLLGYSISSNRVTLSEHKLSAFNNREISGRIHLKPAVSIKISDYRELLSVLEIVIAY